MSITRFDTSCHERDVFLAQDKTAEEKEQEKLVKSSYDFTPWKTVCYKDLLRHQILKQPPASIVHFYKGWTAQFSNTSFPYLQGDMEAGSILNFGYWKDYSLKYMDLYGRHSVTRRLSFGYINDKGERAAFALMWSDKDPSNWTITLAKNPESSNTKARKQIIFVHPDSISKDLLDLPGEITKGISTPEIFKEIELKALQGSLQQLIKNDRVDSRACERFREKFLRSGCFSDVDLRWDTIVCGLTNGEFSTFVIELAKQIREKQKITQTTAKAYLSSQWSQDEEKLDLLNTIITRQEPNFKKNPDAAIVYNAMKVFVEERRVKKAESEEKGELQSQSAGLEMQQLKEESEQKMIPARQKTSEQSDDKLSAGDIVVYIIASPLILIYYLLWFIAAGAARMLSSSPPKGLFAPAPEASGGEKELSSPKNKNKS